MDLIIVESPTKAKKIQSMLGSGYAVAASFGHIRDLPANAMGIEYGNWNIKYQLTDKGKKAFSNLKNLAAKSQTIYLATDPDREGEAIAWHLAVMLKIPLEKARRVKYNEITKSAIVKALSNSTPLDMNLVRAQEARRALDRLVGYTVSPTLSRAVNEKLSAGRVQSVAVRLIVDRYNENQSFVSVDYYGAQLLFDGFSADWDYKPFIKVGEKYNFDRPLAVKASQVEQVKVLSVESKPRFKKPNPPFTTSTLQQAGVKELGLSIDEVMKLAQELFENSFITYHRTDSVMLADEAVAEIRQYAVSKGLPIPETPNKFDGKAKNAQEAHEAIRPTHIEDEEIDGVSESAKRLYKLIYQQTLACQLKPAELRDTKAILESLDSQFQYEAKGSLVIDAGYMVYSGQSEDKVLPKLSEGMVIDVVEGMVKDQKTQPPSLFNESSLIKELERLGIGRPSTWASIMLNIKNRGYITAGKGKAIVPTDVGQRLRKALDGFGFLEYSFTAEIEDQMDEISNGRDDYKACVSRVFKDVFADIRDRFSYEGAPEDFFVPASERDYPASEKQVEAAKRIADALGISLSDVDLKSGKDVSAFLEKNYEAYKLSRKPSEKQIEYAETLASQLNIELPADARSSAVKLSQFIDKNREKAMANTPPSEKQIQFAEQLADKTGATLPADYKTSLMACKNFIDKNYSKSGKRKKSTKKTS
jgi:DNA topoisomerase-1